jgi:hypothetical protein
MMRGSWPEVGAVLPNRQAIFVARQTIYRLTDVCQSGNLTSANGDEPMNLVEFSEALSARAADNALTAYIARIKSSMGQTIEKTREYQHPANVAAAGAAFSAAQEPGADVLSVYDAAFNAAFTSLTARFDPNAEEMLDFERSVGQ